MINSLRSALKAPPLLAFLAIHSTALAQSVTVGIGEGGTQIEAGAVNTTKDGLNAEAGQLWGVSNTANRDGMLYFTYSSLAGTNLPNTIQAGTYTFTARIGSSNVGGGFSGLNDLSAGSNTGAGNVAGFFSTLSSNAEVAKNNMVAEFNTQAGVSYTQASEADPAPLGFTTWTFTWTVSAGSPVIGTNPFFGVYTKTGTGGGNGFWDDSTLTYSGSAAPGQTNSINVNFHANDGNALADHQLTSGETAGVAPLDGSHWNNINLGAPQAQSGATIFTSAVLSDELGNSSAATLSSDLNSGASGSWFVGYAASSASDQAELSNGISDDTLFNSYLATNNSDNFSLNISGLGSGFTAGGYNLIIYSDSDRRGSTANNTRRSIYTITPNGGSPITGFVEDDDGVTPVNTFDGTYIQSDGVDNGSDYSNYVVFSGLTSADFTLEIDSPDGGRGAISGFQIISQAGSDPLPTIADFSADIDTLTAPGTAVTLSWDVAEATALSISPDIGD
ncbi:hypothetical protein N9139_01690, partial [Akkermansiaceae bacterium]|nr:hypothetical protein [Akkermansiaceae bacterium]